MLSLAAAEAATRSSVLVEMVAMVAEETAAEMVEAGAGTMSRWSLVTPSQVNTFGAGINPKVYGTGFTSNTVVEINGTPQPTFFQSSTELWTSINAGTLDAPGVYLVTVSGASPTNTLPLTVYSQIQGPSEPFIALPGFYTGVQNAPAPIAVGDLNGDGHDDVVICAGPGTGTETAILFGQANGSLAPPQYLTQGGDAVAIGDVNGDGFPDIIVGDYPAVGGNSQFTSSITIFLNDGMGNFAMGTTQSFAGTYPGPMVLGDFRGTGRNDLVIAVVGSPGTLYLFPNQGNGTFGQPITLATMNNLISFVVADFDGDGKPDIAYSGVDTSITSSSTHLLINQGNGSFNDIVPTALANTGGELVAGDFNNDGRPDLALEIENQRAPIPLKIFLNTGNNSFALASTIPLGTLSLYAPYKFVVGDFDHDGLMDIAAQGGGSAPSTLLFLWGDGTGNFTQQQVIGPSGFELAAGDINGDGIPDLVIPEESLCVTVLTGRSGRTYPQPTILNVPEVNAVAIGDVNGDGFPDLLFVGDTRIPSSIFLNDGHGNFTLAGRPPLVGPGTSEALADLNRNGKADLVGTAAISGGGEAIVVYPTTGDPNFSSSPVIVPIPAGIAFSSGFQVADLDGDGLPDLIFDEGIAWNQGNYQFTFTPLNTNGVLGIGDVNNDGRPDLITANGTFLNQGNRQFTNIYVNGLGATFGYQVVFGDFNGDGIVDVAFADLVVERIISVAYGGGDGTFYEQSSFATSESSLGSVVKLAAGDFNRDGLTDLVVPLLFGSHVMVLTSTRNGQFQTSFFAAGFLPQDMLEADLNMDGKPDLIILGGTPTNFVEIVFGQ